VHLQVGGALIIEDAWVIQAQKAEKAVGKQLAKEARVASRAASQAQKKLHQAGVKARKQERLCKKRVVALWKAGWPIPPTDQDPIPDPKAEAKAQARALEEEESESRSGSGSESESESESDEYEN
jgi:hypothetical protein